MPVACQSRAVTEPQRDSGASAPKGSPEGRLEQCGKDSAEYRKDCHCEERSDAAIRSPCNGSTFLCSVKRGCSLKCEHWSRNDNFFFTLLSLFSNGALYTPETPQSSNAASSPKRGAKGCGALSLRQCRIFAAKRCPFQGSEAAAR